MVKKKKGGPSVWEMESNTETSATDTEASTTDFSDIEEKDSLEELDERSDIEKELFSLINDGDKEAINSFIETNRKNIDVKHRDLDGDDILTHAVETEDKEIVTLVLEINTGQIDIYNGLITAIRNDNMAIVLALLNFEDVRQGGAFYQTTKKLLEAAEEKRKLSLKGKSVTDVALMLDENKYGNNVTPLMEAAKNGHYEIMQVLYDRGERLPQLHLPSCDCSECLGQPRSLEKILKRIELLKARANPSYLIFMASQDGSFDPILESFNLCGDISACCGQDPAFESEYMAIAAEVNGLPAALINLCRTTDETKIMLAQRECFSGPANHPFPRLGLAIDWKQRSFVTQKQIQFLVHNAYIGQPWRTKTLCEKVTKMLVIILMMVLFPVFNLIMWLGTFCCNQLPIIQFLLSPINRSWSKLGSHIYFFALLLYMNSEERAPAEAEPPTIWVRCIVMVYVLSHFLVLLRLYLLNRNGFWGKGWNRLDTMVQLLFWSWFLIWMYLIYRNSEMRFEEYTPRQQLSPLDPLLIGDCLFAVASTFSSLKIMRWFVLTKNIGPIQTAMSGMWKQGFQVLILIIMVTFMVVTSTKIIYRPFLSLKEFDQDTGKEKEQVTDLCTFEKLLLIFFSADEFKDQTLIVPNKSFVNSMGELDTVKSPQEITQHYLTLLGIFFRLCVVGYISPSIIGLFGSRGSDILEDKEISWPFLLIQEWIYHIQDTYLTPPFNILPTITCVSDVTAISSSKKRSGSDDIESHDDEEDEARRQYPHLLRKLFIRYFQEKRHKEMEEELPVKHNVASVQQTVKEVRELSLELVGQQAKPKPSSSNA